MPRTSLVAPKGAQRSLQNSKFRQKHENPYIRQFSLSIFTGNRANFLGSYLKKYSEIKKSESTFFYYFFILYNFVIEHLASKSILTNFLFFFFFFAFEIVFLKGVSKKCILCADEFPKLLTQSILVRFTQKNKQCD